MFEVATPNHVQECERLLCRLETDFVLAGVYVLLFDLVPTGTAADPTEFRQKENKPSKQPTRTAIAPAMYLVGFPSPTPHADVG